MRQPAAELVHHQFGSSAEGICKSVKAIETVRPWLRTRKPLCQSLKARVISKALPVRIARNPISPGETGVNRQFKRIKGAINFTENRQCAGRVVNHGVVVRCERKRLLAPLLRTLNISEPAYNSCAKAICARVVGVEIEMSCD